MRHTSIGLNGVPGAGKTSLLELLKKKYEYEVFPIGLMFYQRWEKWMEKCPQYANVPFDIYWKEHVTQAEIEDINKEAEERIRMGRVIVDSRYLPVNAMGQSMLNLFVTAGLRIRGERIFNSPHPNKSKKESIEATMAYLDKRERDELERGRVIYGRLMGPDFDYRKFRYYDSVFDTGLISLEEEDAAVEKAMHSQTWVISGLPGAGSSSVSRALAKRKGYSYWGPGKLFKQIGQGRIIEHPQYNEFYSLCRSEGVEIPQIIRATNETDSVLNLWEEEFGKDIRLHRVIDSLQKWQAAKGDYVIDGKLSIRNMSHAEVKIWMNAGIEERIRRTRHRDGLTYQEAKAKIEYRETVERREWKRMFGFDYFDQERDNGVIVIDSSNIPEDKLPDFILDRVKAA